jgi:hypothetical protein
LSKAAPAAAKILASEELGDMFDLDMATLVGLDIPHTNPTRPRKQPAKKIAARKTSKSARKARKERD